MRIERLVMEGFGRLHQQEIELTAPVTVLLGPNEAGKTTAAAFIRTMLYGFPRRGGSDRYEPLAGGRHGGRLVLTTDRRERLTIERLDRRDGLRIWDESGHPWSETELHRAIGGYEGDLFRRMFAFSLSELQEVRLMESEDVSRYLYTVGLGRDGGKSLLEAERRLTAEMERLFKHKGSVQLIPQKAREAEALAAKLQAARGQSEAYNALVEQLQACEEAMQAAESQADAVRSELNWLEVCVEAREEWMALQAAEARLAAQPERERSVPEGAVEQLNKWREQAERLEEEKLQTRQALDRHLSEREELVLLEGREAFRQRLEPLLERLASAVGDLDRLKETELELQELEEAVARSLRAISPHWTVEQLHAYPLSQAEFEQVRAFRDRQNRLRATADGLEAERREREGRCLLETNAWEDAEREWQQLQKERRHYPELAALPYAERVRLIRQYMREAERWAELERECRHIRERLDDAERMQQWRQESQGRSARAKRSPRAWWAAGAERLAWIGAAAGLAAFGARGEWGAAVLCAAMGSMLAIAARLGPWTRRTETVLRQQTASGPDAAEPLRMQLRDWEKRREQAQDSCRELLARLLPAAPFIAASQEARTSGTIASASVQFEESGISARAYRDKADLAGWRDLLEELLPLEEKLELGEERLRGRERALQRARDEVGLTVAREAEHQAAAAAERDRWEAWLASRKLAQDTSPDAALALLQMIDKGQETASRAEHGARQAALLQARISSFHAELRSLLLDYPEWRPEEGESRPIHSLPSTEGLPAEAAEWTSCLKGLQQKLRDQEALARRADRLDEQLAQLRESLAAHEASLTRIDRDRKELLQEAGNASEEELLHQAGIEEERRELTEQKRHFEHILQFRLGGRPLAALDSVWQARTLPEVQSDREQLACKLQERSAERQATSSRKAKLQAELERLIQDEEYAALLQAYKEAKNGLRELAAQWTVRAMAQEWFRSARETYEQERQPAVMQKASTRFAQMTGGAYTRVYTTIGEGKLEVEHASGTRLDPGQLSRGTCEQLLLAIRFAVAEETADRMVMPLLMDDVFVNFDPERLARCWDIVHEISERHQIVYFTCHPHIAETARRRNNAVQVLQINP
ncbi:hypothetical protein DUZ99_08355 [Xylanibacillus composti]|uniref:YhaN AAA domain-containing protein n=1 Tax=Xylanibacillus composti TaxID=1572762 RepID=A0A8J4H9D8_9BACL|nr:AAA family ATPase [Xylanibacillus composti]MDT9725005.1 hypothetical protein [Xylanibacillus composti]GIQ71298.1 hypothetical protein XYCOK13_41220 [Xylanibacillus composti]